MVLISLGGTMECILAKYVLHSIWNIYEHSLHTTKYFSKKVPGVPVHDFFHFSTRAMTQVSSSTMSPFSSLMSLLSSMSELLSILKLSSNTIHKHICMYVCTTCTSPIEFDLYILSCMLFMWECVISLLLISSLPGMFLSCFLFS